MMKTLVCFTWLSIFVQGRSNLPPDKIPWSALRTLVSQCIYGGRIDNDFDQVRVWMVFSELDSDLLRWHVCITRL